MIKKLLKSTLEKLLIEIFYLGKTKTKAWLNNLQKKNISQEAHKRMKAVGVCSSTIFVYQKLLTLGQQSSFIENCWLLTGIFY